MILLDGGMGRHLKEIGAPFGQPEWSALALIDDPSYVLQAHNDFIDAGSDYITTNSYAIIPFHLGNKIFSEKAKELLKLSGELAKKAKENSKTSIKIAVSIPPVLGSYKPEVFNSNEARPILELFRDILLPYGDVILGETLSSVEEIILVQDVFKECGKPLWISLTLEDDTSNQSTSKLRSGESLDSALKNIDFRAVDSILFNCSQPEVMERAIITAKNFCQKNILIGVYANTFPPINSSQKEANNQLREMRKELDPAGYLIFAEKWQKAGALIIGGCCGIGPKHIKELNKLR
ncbi:homocysteine S-methyltransferase family protein [Pelagibacterales bacterium]|nr:homocysteine S-methyltransferase family protein [Pelagibacterales bacterium]